MKTLAIFFAGLIGAASLLPAAPDAGQPATPSAGPSATSASSPAPTAPSPGGTTSAAEAVSATTGLAISPLFGMGALGAWHWWKAPEQEREKLPWHNHPGFWLPALLVVILLAAKEPVLYFLPGAKKPLDLLEVLENKASALVAAPLILHLAEKAFGTTGGDGTSANLVLAGFDFGTTAAIAFGAFALLSLFFCVWLSSHAINMLILISPSATLDMLMRGFRTMVLGIVAGSALLNPWVGLVVALGVLYLAIRCFGWAWRLLFYGSTLAYDLVVRHKSSAPPEGGRVRAFLKHPRGGLPRRSRGWLFLGPTGELTFQGSPLPWLAKVELVFPARSTRLVRTLTGPDLHLEGETPIPLAVVSLPPRFNGSEETLGQFFGIDATTEHPAARNWQAAMRWLGETLGSRVKPNPLGTGHD
jgi:hypothetical protein